MSKGKRNRAFRAMRPKPQPLFPAKDEPRWKPTPAQQAAMDEEINRQILERDAEFTDDFDASVLWVLHRVFGFGPARLRRFWEAFRVEHDALRKHYEMNETGWISRQKLKEKGVDVSAWNKEDTNA